MTTSAMERMYADLRMRGAGLVMGKGADHVLIPVNDSLRIIWSRADTPGFVRRTVQLKKTWGSRYFEEVKTYEGDWIIVHASLCKEE